MPWWKSRPVKVPKELRGIKGTVFNTVNRKGSLLILKVVYTNGRALLFSTGDRFGIERGCGLKKARFVDSGSTTHIMAPGIREPLFFFLRTRHTNLGGKTTLIMGGIYNPPFVCLDSLKQGL